MLSRDGRSQRLQLSVTVCHSPSTTRRCIQRASPSNQSNLVGLVTRLMSEPPRPPALRGGSLRACGTQCSVRIWQSAPGRPRCHSLAGFITLCVTFSSHICNFTHPAHRQIHTFSPAPSPPPSLGSTEERQASSSMLMVCFMLSPLFLIAVCFEAKQRAEGEEQHENKS